MIIELFGSPGAGKTYAINKIHPGAVREEKGVRDQLLNPIKRIIKSLITFFPYAFRVRRIIRNCILGETVEAPKYKPVDISDFIRNISMLSVVYKMSCSDVYMDEGIVHRTISMCINYGVSKETCSKIIKELFFVIKDVRVIFLDVPKENCLKSINRRNRHAHSIDELSGKKLNAFLSSYEEYCQYICESFNFERIERTGVALLGFIQTE